jgi:hypothetical protein
MTMKTTTMKFPLGQIVATPGALEHFAPVYQSQFLRRHASGDWGNLDPEDKASNDAALKAGEESRILSAYVHPVSGERLWIITEWDRSVTTLLLPNEY